MEIKKFLNKWTIVSLIIGNLLAFVFAKLVMDSLFAGIIFSLIFVGTILIHAIIHSLYYFEVKNKLIVSSLDIIPLISYMIVLSFLENDYSEILVGILTLYLPAVIVITFLSWGLTKAFVYIKFRTGKK
ncbi:MAG: hypothetical protein V1888_02895 [archaeon]